MQNVYQNIYVLKIRPDFGCECGLNFYIINYGKLINYIDIFQCIYNKLLY